MVINGLARLTLLDYPGKTAATVFLGGCNMRCPFCHNAPLVTGVDNSEIISEDELRAFLSKRSGLLDGIAITGGEPTLRPELDEFIRMIRSYGYSVKLDTNGTRPAVLRRLIDEGLVDYVAMDIKNSPDKYPETVGVPGFDVTPIAESVRLLEESGVDHEFRTTVVAGLHTADSMKRIGEWLRNTEKYFLQNFVDSGALIVPGTVGVSREMMEQFLGIIRQYIPRAELRGL